MPYLEVNNVFKSYGPIKALRGVTFNVNKGEYLCILGPTGAGKTTLLKIIAGLLKPDKGKVYLEGEDITNLPPEERGIVYMPQGYALFPHLTVWENVAYGVLTRGLPLKRAEKALKAVGLFHRRNSYPHELSGGQQQRVALARALASGSKILLLDEPLSALDLLLNIQLRYELRKYAKNLGLTVIHVTHNAEEAMSIADRLLVLNKGKIEQIGKPEDVYLHPKSAFVASFLSDVVMFRAILIKRMNDSCIFKINNLGNMLIKCSNPPDKRVLIAIRPEDIKMDLTKKHPLNTFKGIVENVEFEGIKTRVTVRINEHTFFIDLMFVERVPLRRGSQVFVHIPPDKPLIFPLHDEMKLKELISR